MTREELGEGIFGCEVGDVVRSEFGAGTEEIGPIDPAGTRVSDIYAAPMAPIASVSDCRTTAHNWGSSAASWIVGMMRPSVSTGMSVFSARELRRLETLRGAMPPPSYDRPHSPYDTLFIHLNHRNSFIWMIANWQHADDGQLLGR